MTRQAQNLIQQRMAVDAVMSNLIHVYENNVPGGIGACCLCGNAFESGNKVAGFDGGGDIRPTCAQSLLRLHRSRQHNAAELA